MRTLHLGARAFIPVALAGAVLFSLAPSTPAAATTTTEAQQIIRIARAQLGDHWRYGATGPRAFDCSGLVVYAFRKAGDARAIHTDTCGRPARSTAGSRHTARPAGPTRRIGDLVVWGGGTHIGIYIGRGKAISTLAQRRAHPRRSRGERQVHRLPAHGDVDQTRALTAGPSGAHRTRRRPDDPARDLTAGVVGIRLVHPRAQARITAADRSMSSSVVDQPETDTRIAACPAQVVPPRNSVPSRCTASMTARVRTSPLPSGSPAAPRTGRGPGRGPRR